MRLLRLDFGDDLHRLDLHPLVTVVDDLSPDQQQQLFTVVRELARGTARSFRGLVEHGGTLTEVQRPGDLKLDQKRRCAFDVVLHIDDHAGALEPAGLRVEIDQCQRQAEVDAVRLEELRADLQPSLWADVVLLRSRLDSVVDNTSTVPVPAPSSVSSPSTRPITTSASAGLPAPPPSGNTQSSERIDTDGASNAEHDRLRAVVAAIDDVMSRPRHLERFSPEISELLNQWSRFVEIREHHSDHLSVLERQLDEAQDRVRRAENALVEAEEAAKPVLLSDADEARLEALAERAESAGGGWRRRSSGLSSEEQQELNGLMAKVGVSSWTEYSMFRLAPEVAPERQEAIEQARLELTEAESELREAEVAVGSDPVAMELESEYSRLRSEAMGHLGAVVPNDVGSGLRELAEHLDNPEWLEAVNQLDRMLHDLGVTDSLLAGDDPDQLLEWARVWVEYELSRLDSDRSVPAPEFDSTPVGVVHDPAKSVQSVTAGQRDDVEVLRRALDTAERRLVRHRTALNRFPAVQARAAASNERLGQLRRLADEVRRPHGTTGGEVVASMSPVIHQIRSDLGHAVPIVLSGSLPHLSPTEIAQFMDRLEELATEVQIIVVAGRSEAVDWATSAGPTRALHATGTARSLWSTLP